MPRALISVSDKRGVAQFANGLVSFGWEIVSTGGTAHVLTQAGVGVIPIEEVTGFPEIMGGRVKTLHPAVHSSLLARRNSAEHMEELESRGFAPIDLVAVNLYPFRETIGKPNVKLEDAIEQIDIGGPSMLRSAAKNHQFVLPVVDPNDYDRVLEAIESGVTPTLRLELAAKVFAHTAAYDASIAQFLGKDEDTFPAMMGLALERVRMLRYGENPYQRAALYTTGEGRGFDGLRQLHGKELSFNNLLDVEAATAAVAAWPDRPVCAIIKHTTPCGIALGTCPEEAYRRALATDSKSAFGSVIAYNTVVDVATAEAMHDLFVEVVVAPRFHDGAIEVFRRKKNLRVVELPLADSRPALDFKRVRGGFLVQDRFGAATDESEWNVVTAREPTHAEWRDLRFAWSAVAMVKSNAILLAKNEAAIGIGAGQMSRVDSSFIAVHKARDAGHDTAGSVMGSDAFFPFADGIEHAAAAGVTAVIQPGGSIRDDEVKIAADAHDMAMVFTGRRQFRH